MIRPGQLRAARALLDWTRADCSAAAGVSPETIRNIEKGRSEAAAVTARNLVLGFAARNVGFFERRGAQEVWGVFQRQPADNDNDPVAGDRQAQERLALAGQMADIITATVARRGYCRPRDLETKGFTREQIADCWAIASALAAIDGWGR